MKIILISGKAEAGKTTSANIIKNILELNDKRVAIVPYASYVKETAKLIFGWDGKKDEHGRELLQRWGTDIVRKAEPDFWVDTVMRLAHICSKTGILDYLIIDDVRFPNEIISWYSVYKSLYASVEKVISIKVERPGYSNHLTEEQRQHPSETALDDYYGYDYIVSATNKLELEEELIKIFGE